MVSINYVILSGNLGRDVELRYTPKGRPVVQFTLASHYMRGSVEKKTSWVDCEAFGEYLVHMAADLKKGVAVIIEGKIIAREFTDKAGQMRKKTEIDVKKIILPGSGTSYE